MTTLPKVANKIPGLQVARALAVMLVLVTHAIAHPYPSAPSIIQLFAREGVTIFFVISGYIMAIICANGPFEPLGFVRKRFLRVAPLYYAVTLLTLAVAIVMPTVFKSTVVDARHLFYSLAFLPMFSPDQEHSVTPFVKLGWTLNYEMFFYLSFAVLHKLQARARAIILTGVFSALVILGLLVPQTTAIGLFVTDITIIGFPAGVLLATFLHRNHEMRGFDASIVALVGIAIFTAVATQYDLIRDALLTQLVLVGASACVVHAMAMRRTWKPDWFGRSAIFIGDTSYSIYLLHMFAVGLTYTVGRHFVPEQWLLVLSPLAFAGGLLAGILGYLMVEKPLLKAVSYGQKNTRAPVRLPA